MTRKMPIPPRMTLPEPEFVGPFSRWPRKETRRPSVRAMATTASAVVAAAVFAHCIVPMI
ncbi:hypothetical protein [Defluviimonas sp. WL0075]|uniref:Uncharacterized protein n=1 Tax=Albidovulum sediminicola TaxID=2984331 RepID=A0ABT2YZC1_9RHOB|nr:hypothetical protein [Defluviimonas sp. WL0075]MCV2864207.1 hypothetical protein [Defluviimonas sp. WL0075]